MWMVEAAPCRAFRLRLRAQSLGARETTESPHGHGEEYQCNEKQKEKKTSAQFLFQTNCDAGMSSWLASGREPAIPSWLVEYS